MPIETHMANSKFSRMHITTNIKNRVFVVVDSSKKEKMTDRIRNFEKRQWRNSADQSCNLIGGCTILVSNRASNKQSSVQSSMSTDSSLGVIASVATDSNLSVKKTNK